jgi:hypothetical protein
MLGAAAEWTVVAVFIAGEIACFIRGWVDWGNALAFAANVLAAVLTGFPAGMINALAAVWVLLWWKPWDRRKRKKLAQLGAKARARVAAMVAKVREAGQPRQVLRPVPGSAR